jgi:hypothetical protein
VTVARTLIVGGLCLAVAAPSASAFCIGYDPDMHLPKDYYSVRKEFVRSAFVAIVEVRSEQWLDEKGWPVVPKPPFQNGSRIPWGFDPYAGANYRVRFIKQFKGRPRGQLTIFSENTDARTPLEKGRRYLLFVNKQREDLRDMQEPNFGWRYTVDNCGNSSWLPAARGLLAELKSLTARRS